ncbi:hypothetical protein FPV67DRAFT_1212961 [Lyophyllum atratum]|nr:hypothetical protein FPV67DRAFT_1212961 [Lyophyllum atratum]
MYGARRDVKVILPGEDIEEHITMMKDAGMIMKELYSGKDRIPMQVFHATVSSPSYARFCGFYAEGTLSQSTYMFEHHVASLRLRETWCTTSWGEDLFKERFPLF